MDIRIATAERWPDLVELFGPRGAEGGCWCMFWRVRGREFGEIAGAAAKERLCGLVTAGPSPGLLAYRDGRAIGWCTVGPRSSYERLLHSPVLKPEQPDEPGVWAVPCFYVHRRARRDGVSRALLKAAVARARKAGARAVEGYPRDAPHRKLQASELYVGTPGMFRDAGFREVARRSPTRPIMRRDLDPPARS